MNRVYSTAAIVGGLSLFWWWKKMETQRVLAQTIYGEARGEGIPGMVAVAWVIRNRADIGGWWGDRIKEVCLKPWQFSTWNENDPNRAKIQNLNPWRGNAVFDRAWVIAGEVMAGMVADPTGGATHYHSVAISPDWADPVKVVATIGNHIFYSNIG